MRRRCCCLAAARAQELEQVRLEFLVDHLQFMADAWDVTGMVAELVEAACRTTRMVDGAKAAQGHLRPLRMLADEAGST